MRVRIRESKEFKVSKALLLRAFRTRPRPSRMQWTRRCTRPTRPSWWAHPLGSNSSSKPSARRVTRSRSRSAEGRAVLDLLVDDDDEDDEAAGSAGDKDEPVTCKDYLLHFITFFWKFLFAFVPPTSKNPPSVQLFGQVIPSILNRYCWWLGLFLCIDSDHRRVNRCYWRFGNTCKELITRDVLFTTDVLLLSLVWLHGRLDRHDDRHCFRRLGHVVTG